MHDQSKPLNPDSAPTETQEAPQAPGKRVSIWVKAWVIFHCVAIFVWATPNPPQGYSPQNPWALRTDGFQNFAQSLNDGYRVFTRDVLKNSPIKQYVQCTSFWQYWDMFAPNPADTDCYGDAIVEYKDGSHYLYAYPRMHDLNLFDRYVNERYRKFFERACTQEFGYTWTQFGQYVALRCYHDPKNPPVKITLRKHRQRVVPANERPSTEYTSEEYFLMYVDQDRLKWDAQSVFVAPYTKPIPSSVATAGATLGGDGS